MGHALTENRCGLVVDAAATLASGYAERLAALAMIEDRADRPTPVTLAADKAYDAADFVMELRELKPEHLPRGPRSIGTCTDASRSPRACLLTRETPSTCPPTRAPL